MKIADILNIDAAELRTMNIERLEKIVKEASRYSERRLKAIEAKGLTDVSPAYNTWSDKLRNNAYKRTSTNRLRLIAELRQNQRFLSAKTGLVKGAREYQKKMKKLLPHVKEEDYDNFWAAVDAIRRLNGIRYAQLSSSAIIAMFDSIWDASKSPEETNAEFMKLFNEEYEKSNEKFKGRGRPDPDKFRK